MSCCPPSATSAEGARARTGADYYVSSRWVRASSSRACKRGAAPVGMAAPDEPVLRAGLLEVDLAAPASPTTEEVHVTPRSPTCCACSCGSGAGYDPPGAAPGGLGLRLRRRHPDPARPRRQPAPQDRAAARHARATSVTDPGVGLPLRGRGSYGRLTPARFPPCNPTRRRIDVSRLGKPHHTPPDPRPRRARGRRLRDRLPREARTSRPPSPRHRRRHACSCRR